MRYLVFLLPFLCGCAAMQGWWQGGGEETVKTVTDTAAAVAPEPWGTAIKVGGGIAAGIAGLFLGKKVKDSEPGKWFG